VPRMDRLQFLSLARQCCKVILPRPLVSLFADPFRRISLLLMGLVISAGVIGMLVLQLVKDALIERAGHTLELAAADAADKLDRLMFERYGDIEMRRKSVILHTCPRIWLVCGRPIRSICGSR
jgi:hypothetical protein